MTALLIILGALFGGLCWAGRRRPVYHYDPDLIADDVEVVCDDSCEISTGSSRRHRHRHRHQHHGDDDCDESDRLEI